MCRPLCSGFLQSFRQEQYFGLHYNLRDAQNIVLTQFDPHQQGLLEKRCGGVTIPAPFRLSETRDGRRQLRAERDLDQKNSELTFRPSTNESKRADRLHAVMGGTSSSGHYSFHRSVGRDEDLEA